MNISTYLKLFAEESLQESRKSSLSASKNILIDGLKRVSLKVKVLIGKVAKINHLFTDNVRQMAAGTELDDKDLLVESESIKSIFTKEIMLPTPEGWKVRKITPANKEEIVKFLADNVEHVLLISNPKSEKSKRIYDIINKATREIFKPANLRKYVKIDLEATYANIVLVGYPTQLKSVSGGTKILNNLILKTGPLKRAHELLVFTQFRLDPKKIVETRAESDDLKRLNITHILTHPEDKGNFPDAVIIFADDRDGTRIKNEYNIDPGEGEILIKNVESKAYARTVGTQTSVGLMRKKLGEGLFHKIFSLVVKDSVVVSGKETLKILDSMKIVLEDSPFYINLTGRVEKTKKRKVLQKNKVLQLKKDEISKNKTYVIERGSNFGFQLKRNDDDKKTLITLEVSIRGKNKEKEKKEFLNMIGKGINEI
tara:strand:- start:342 stop:1622 length:1281 start_codon:yes stop_codon:yes gene_type:complete